MRIVFPGAESFIPTARTLPVLQSAVQKCEGCDLYKHATQAVFGEGQKRSRLFLIGEQPGNDEDLEGHPFVGPAGKMLDKALKDAGIDRSKIYGTNIVKHFKFEERGKRRLHKKPLAGEIKACKPWLEAEVQLIRPKAIVCLGATASQALLGSKFRISQMESLQSSHPWAEHVVATIHPSAILRAPDPELRREHYERLVEDLRTAYQFL